MRALAIASALFSVLLFTLNGALARVSDRPAQHSRAHPSARTPKAQARQVVGVRLPKSAT
jgi:hypothetical protein